MITVCPSQEELKSLSLGKLPEDICDDLILHISDCDACQSELSDLDRQDDTFIGSLKSQALVETDEFSAEQECRLASGKALAALANVDHESLSPSVPRVIGEYEILEPIASGGMGHVFLGRHTKLGRRVAIKLIAEHRRWDSTMHDRFASEMRTIGGLNHPNIVVAHDAREVDGVPVLVTEYIEGMDVGTIVRRQGNLAAADACKIIQQVCLALEYCDKKGLVHRDIKPSNIMIDEAGNVKLLDLGLARLQTADERTEFTATGQAIGTADYVAPEQINDGRNVDIRTDIYALGCTFFKLLVGRAPFADEGMETAFAKMNAHVSQKAPSVKSLNREAPSELDRLIAAMVEKEPANRPQSPAIVAAKVSDLAEQSDLAKLVAETKAMSVQEQTRPKTEPKRAPKNHSVQPAAGWRTSWVALIATALLAAALGVWLGITITIKKQDGTSATVVIPDGSKAIIDEAGNVEIVLGGTGERLNISSSNVENRQADLDLAKRTESARHPKQNDAGFGYDSETSTSETKLAKSAMQITILENHPLFNRVEQVDTLDLFVNNPQSDGEYGQRLLASDVRIRSIAFSQKLNEIEFATTRSLSSKLGQLGKDDALSIELHDPNRKVLYETAEMNGVWRIILTKLEDGKMDALPENSAILICRGQAMFFNGGQQPRVSKLFVLDRGRIELFANNRKERGTYRFLPSGNLEVGVELPPLAKNNRGGSVNLKKMVFRLTKLRPSEASNEAEKNAFRVMDSTRKAQRSLEFVLLNDSEEREGKPVVTSADILSAVAMKGNADQWSIQVTLTFEAGERMRRFTAANLKRKMGVFVDGTLMQAPVIQSEIGSACAITGDYTEQQAKDLAEKIVPKISLDGVDLEGQIITNLVTLKLRKLSLGILNYESAVKCFPCSQTEKGGLPPVSWRVAILPYLGEQALYEQYDLNEPWDSETNLKVLQQMPEVYRLPGAPANSTNTGIVSFAGGNTLIGEKTPMTYGGLDDGANTLMLLTSDTEIPWTKPEDFRVNDDLLGQIKTDADGKFFAAATDGMIYPINKKDLDQSSLKALIEAKKSKAFQWDQLKKKSEQSKESPKE